MTVTTANAKVAKALQCHLPPQAHVFCERPFAHPAGAEGRLGASYGPTRAPEPRATFARKSRDYIGVA